MPNRQFAELAREANRLQQRFPQGRSTMRDGTLRWVGELRPTEVSVAYRVELIYSPPGSPRVYVREPTLCADDSGRLPHIYADGGLCLHEEGQWSPGDQLAETIVPWTSEWLLHYEFWRATGEWKGSGGNHTGPIKRAEVSRPRKQHRRTRRRSR